MLIYMHIKVQHQYYKRKQLYYYIIIVVRNNKSLTINIV
jgi:hypothetical protein